MRNHPISAPEGCRSINGRLVILGGGGRHNRLVGPLPLLQGFQKVLKLALWVDFFWGGWVKNFGPAKTDPPPGVRTCPTPPTPTFFKRAWATGIRELGWRHTVASLLRHLDGHVAQVAGDVRVHLAVVGLRERLLEDLHAGEGFTGTFPLLLLKI